MIRARFLKKQIELKKKANGKAEMKLAVDDFAIYKTKAWSFQEEVRFILFILPTIPIPPDGFSNEKYLRELPDFILNSIINGNGPKLESFDIDINPTVLDNINVTLGPLCDEGDKTMVESLLKTYTKNGSVVKSKISRDN